MITLFQYIPNVGSLVELNDLNYPLHVCEIETTLDPREFKKMSESGEWPTYTYPGAMTIHAEGDIVGYGGTPSNDYVAKRMALLDAVLPPIGVLQARHHGTVRIRLDGMTENADALVVITQQSIPMKSLYPSISEFSITWKAFLPYFTGVSTQTKSQLG